MDGRILDDNSFQELTLQETITTLSLKTNKISDVSALSLPSGVESVDLSGNSITSMSNWQMPDNLKSFTCTSCQITDVSGIWFPSASEASMASGSNEQQFQTFDLSESSISLFVVSNSSVAVLEAVSNLKVKTSFTSCPDSRAELVTIQSDVSLCVLSDSDFAASYTSSGSGNSAVVQSSEDDGGGMNKWMLLAIVSVSVLLGVVLSGVAFVLYRRHQRKKDGNKDVFESTLASTAAHLRSGANHDRSWADAAELTASAKATSFVAADGSHNNTLTRTARTDSAPSAHNNASGSHHRSNNNTMLAVGGSNEYLANDIRTDEELQRFRLLQEEVEIGSLIAQGGYGAVYLANFRNEEVVIKQLLPDKARHKRTLTNFMDEIRLAAQLDHPKIVKFIGVTWSSLLDVSMVMEYMPRGDLSALLFSQLQREAREPLARDAYSWFHAFDGALAKCKSLLALDVAEALVYLHSFENPIIHRDLKPKNVLLNDAWVAKLTDFGVSREMTGDGEDQTMTGEVGTISWIAPEVLRGERYSVKADVYSFGVLLSELDTCRRPYSEGIPIGGDADDMEEGRNQPTNTRIAVLVSAGNLRPTVAPDCPRSVRTLVEKCLSFDPRERPTAVQIHYELRHLELGEEELSASGVRLNRAMSKSNK